MVLASIEGGQRIDDSVDDHCQCSGGPVGDSGVGMYSCTANYKVTCEKVEGWKDNTKRRY